MSGELRPAVGGVDGYAGALGGLGRRDFLKFCTEVAATAGAVPPRSASASPKRRNVESNISDHSDKPLAHMRSHI